MNIRIKKLTVDARVPEYAHRGDAGLDLFARETVVVKKGERARVPTGVAIAVPAGYAGLIWDKSGLAQKHGLKTLGGVLDSGYRGEVVVGLVNTSGEDYTIEKGHKTAQLLIQKVEQAQIEIVDDLDDTSRGEGGFGSTGK